MCPNPIPRGSRGPLDGPRKGTNGVSNNGVPNVYIYIYI